MAEMITLPTPNADKGAEQQELPSVEDGNANDTTDHNLAVS
jgi:hypothetical protein